MRTIEQKIKDFEAERKAKYFPIDAEILEMKSKALQGKDFKQLNQDEYGAFYERYIEMNNNLIKQNGSKRRT